MKVILIVHITVNIQPLQEFTKLFYDFLTSVFFNDFMFKLKN